MALIWWLMIGTLVVVGWGAFYVLGFEAGVRDTERRWRETRAGLR